MKPEDFLLAPRNDSELDAAWNRLTENFVRASSGADAPAALPPKCCCPNEGKPYWDEGLQMNVQSRNAGCRIPGHGAVSALGQRGERRPNRGGQCGIQKRGREIYSSHQ